MSDREKLLQEIDEFLIRLDMGPAAFGRRALNDPAFLTRFRGGSDIRLETAERLRKFMAEFRPPLARLKRAGRGSAPAAAA